MVPNIFENPSVSPFESQKPLCLLPARSLIVHTPDHNSLLYKAEDRVWNTDEAGSIQMFLKLETHYKIFCPILTLFHSRAEFLTLGGIKECALITDPLAKTCWTADEKKEVGRRKKP